MSRKKNLLTPGLKTQNLCLNTTLATVKHYFPSLIRYFKEVTDFRQLGKVKYPPELMLWMGIIERLVGLKSNNEFESLLRTSTEIEDNIFQFLKRPVDELPGIDAFCSFMQQLHPEELHKVIRKMLSALERKKFLSKLKTKDNYLLLAIDGVQTLSTTRPIEHSTYREHKNKPKTYHQYFLEAKIVSPDGFVISIDTEFIENPVEEFDKQDCERKAAYRLLERVAREHPHLKFRILGDALYCNSVLIDICNRNHWKYSFTFKGKTQYPKLLKDIKSILNFRQRHNRRRCLLKENKNSKLYIELSWCNNVPYEFGGEKEYNLNYLEGKVIRVKNGVETVVTTLSYLISESITKGNVLRKFMECRKRWKIENEGFNFQKNNILHIGHNFSSVGHAGQNFYLLAQIAHTIIQLAYFTDVAGHVRLAMTNEKAELFQTLQSIFRSFKAVAQRMRVEFFEKVFKPPLLPEMRIKLKFA